MKIHTILFAWGCSQTDKQTDRQTYRQTYRRTEVITYPPSFGGGNDSHRLYVYSDWFDCILHDVAVIKVIAIENICSKVHHKESTVTHIAPGTRRRGIVYGPIGIIKSIAGALEESILRLMTNTANHSSHPMTRWWWWWWSHVIPPSAQHHHCPASATRFLLTTTFVRTGHHLVTTCLGPLAQCCDSDTSVAMVVTASVTPVGWAGSDRLATIAVFHLQDLLVALRNCLSHPSSSQMVHSWLLHS